MEADSFKDGGQEDDWARVMTSVLSLTVWQSGKAEVQERAILLRQGVE